MSILDTFSILFDSNADEVEKGAQQAEQAGKRLEEQLGATGSAGEQAAAAIASANDEAANSYDAWVAALAEVQGALGETDAQSATSSTAAVASTDKATQANKQLGAAVAETGHTGVHAAHEVEEAHGRLANSFEHLKEKAKEFSEGIVEQAFEIAAAFKALFEVEKLVDNFFEQAERSDQMGEKARSLGVAVEELDAWGQAVKHVGGSSEGFEQSLRTINMNLERIAITGHSRMKPFLDELHIGMKNANGELKTSFELLDEIPAAIDKMPKSKSGAILRGIGLDEGTIRLMQAGSKETKELVERAKELGTITEKDTEIAEKFNREWMDVKQLFRGMTIEADSFLLPTFDAILHAVESLIEFFREHGAFAAAFFGGLAAAVLYAAEAFGILDFAIGILLSPITLTVAAIIALIAAFAFLYDDIVAFGEGNLSIIGMLAERWPIVGEAVRGLIAVFGEVRDGAVEAFHDIMEWIHRIPEGIHQWGEIFEWIGARIEQFVDYVGSLFEMVPEDAKGALDDLVAIWKNVFEIIGMVAKAGFEGINIAVNAMFEVLKAVFNLIGDLVVNPQHAFQNFAASIGKIFKDVVTAFPQLSEAFANVGKAFDEIGGGIIKLWEHIGALITGTIEKIGGAINGVGSWLTKAGNMIAHPSAWVNGEQGGTPDLAAGQAALAGTQSPLLAQTPQALATGARGDINNNVNITAPATINTQSTDPAAIKGAFDEHLDNHLDSALNHYADGISH